MPDYPLPRHAAYIWFNGDSLQLGLPPVAAEESGHTVALRADDQGFKALLSILRERYHASTRESRRIGTKAAPVQYDLDNMIRHMRQQRELERREAKAEAQDFLKGLNL